MRRWLWVGLLGALGSAEMPMESKEIIWAGLSGNEPKYFETGENKGLGYLEVQTNLVRKAVENAGFQLRYEYFSPARISHEFKAKAPICFYPFEWKDPISYFKNPVDRILSIPINFKGEELRSIVFRRGELSRFKKYLDEKGELNLKALLKDQSLKTLIPSASGVHNDLSGVYQIKKDGSIEIEPPYQRHIETRVLRENNQLIQMLHGSRIDYLLGEFITAEDYKTIKQREEAFERLSYHSQTISTISDPRVLMSSVACSLSPTSVQLMPFLNRAISENRGAHWLQRNLRYQKRFEPDLEILDVYQTLQWRFFGQIGSREGEAWYPLQMKQVEGLRLLPNESGPKGDFPPVGTVSKLPLPKWLALRTSARGIWVMNEADFLDLKYSSEPRWDFGSFAREPASTAGLRASLGPEEFKDLVRAQVLFGAEKAEAVFLRLKNQDQEKSGGFDSLGIVARGLGGGEVKFALPFLTRLKSFALIGGSDDVLDSILPGLPSGLEELNLSDSTLGNAELHPMTKSMNRLRGLSLVATQMKTSDYVQVLLSLPSTLVELRGGWNQRPWSTSLAEQFSRLRLPFLQVLDLTNNTLDDRHCPALLGQLTQPEKTRLRVLKLNGNFFTSVCLSQVFKSGLPSLHTLELAGAAISKKPGAILKLPSNVKVLDLSETHLSSELLPHLLLPKRLMSLRLARNDLDAEAFSKIAGHLLPHLELLDLSDNPKVDGSALKSLSAAQVQEVKELDLQNVRFLEKGDGQKLQSLDSFSIKKINRLMLLNSEVSNSLLRQIADRWGRDLEGIDLSENVITEAGTSYLFEKSPRLRELGLNELLGFDGVSVAARLPQTLISLKLANNGITDRELVALSSRLPAGLKYLELNGSFFGPSGAQHLAERLPNLIKLDVTHAIDEVSAVWLLTFLPPFLKEFAFGPVSLGSRGTEAFLSHVSPHLEGLTLRSTQFDLKDSSRLVRSLPASLRFLYFSGKSSIGDGFVASKPEPLPRNLRELHFYASGISGSHLLSLLKGAQKGLQAIFLRSPSANPLAMREILEKAKRDSQIRFEVGHIPFDRGMVPLINSLGLMWFVRNNCPKEEFDFSEVSKEGMSNLKFLAFLGCPMSTQQLTRLLGKLPPYLFALELRSVGLKYSDVDAFIAALPKGLRRLNVGGNELGPLGVEKLVRYKQQVEEETGFFLDLKAE